MNESLSPQERIRKKKDFLYLYKKGNRYRGKYFNLIYLPNNLTFSRVGVVASKKIGNAVTRNRAKRRMRELFRRNKGLISRPIDLLIVASVEMKKAGWPDLREHYLQAVKIVFERKQKE